MANHFNDLLLQTLKQINVRLDRLDGRMDRLDDGPHGSLDGNESRSNST